MSLEDTRHACKVAQMPKEVCDWIFEPVWIKRAPILKVS